MHEILHVEYFQSYHLITDYTNNNNNNFLQISGINTY